MKRLLLILAGSVATGCSAPEVTVTEYPVDLRRPGLEAPSEEEAAEGAQVPANVDDPSDTPVAAPPAPAAEPVAQDEDDGEGLNLGSSGSNSAARLGVAQFDRSGSGGGDRNCDDFANAEEAQRYFLTAGGPESDPNGLDADGDGFACEWGME